MTEVSIATTINRRDIKLKQNTKIQRQQQSETLADNGRSFLKPMAAFMANTILNKS